MDRFVVVGRKGGGVEEGEGCVFENGEGSVPVVEPDAAALPAKVDPVLAERVLHVKEKTKKKTRRWEGWVRLWKRLSVR